MFTFRCSEPVNYALTKLVMHCSDFAYFIAAEDICDLLAMFRQITVLQSFQNFVIITNLLLLSEVYIVK